MSEFWIQVLGFIALSVNLTASSTLSDTRMKGLIFISCMLFATHYMLLGAVVAGLNLFINSFRAIISIRYKSSWLFYAFLGIQTVFSAIFYEQPSDLIPWLASAFSCYALFMAQGIMMRWMFFICTALWLINSVIAGSYGGMVNDMFNLGILSLTIFRLSRQQAIQ
ncbi:YgjV family protein [Vibrio sp.]|nr:YgjV family protein [Vibrio sp.]